MIKAISLTFALSLTAALLTGTGALAEDLTKRTVLNTAHNLSVTGGFGPGRLQSATEPRVCIFCHTPHHSTPDGPLWSRGISEELNPYTFYWSTTLKAPSPQLPGRASRLCLSCHDGTIALGQLAKGAWLDPALLAISPAYKSYLGTDLSRHHPISIEYGQKTGEFQPEAVRLSKNIKLAEGAFVECTSCHDAHNDQYGKFLVTDTSVQRDALCTGCHTPSGWNETLYETAHRSGGTRFPTEGPKLEKDGCISCHTPHNAERGPQLLKLSVPGAGLDTNCTSTCHRGASYRDLWKKDVFSQFNEAIYKHQVVNNPNQAHDPEEILPLLEPHVECVDCHNPHQAAWDGVPLGSAVPALGPRSIAPNINGPLRGVPGITIAGGLADPASYEYEVCFKCHSGPAARTGSFNRTVGRPARRFEIFDQRYRFLNSNPSFHPVAFARTGDGRSLIDRGQMQIYCSDCHAPHGSNYELMLVEEYSETPSADGSYPLCFRCHEKDFVLNPSAPEHAATARLHQNHVYGQHRFGTAKVSCSACHDPHGVPAEQGATSGNAAHLVNFDTNLAGASATYSVTGQSCTVDCHGVFLPDFPTKTRTYSEAAF